MFRHSFFGTAFESFQLAKDMLNKMQWFFIALCLVMLVLVILKPSLFVIALLVGVIYLSVKRMFKN